MTLLLLDANNLAMRSYHAAKHAMSAAGESTGALQLFVTSLALYTRQEKPTRMVACWDGPGGSRTRLSIYPAYKEARRIRTSDGDPHRDAFRLIMEFCDLAGIPQWRRDGVEADDLIAGAWRRHRAAGERVVILSSDKDLLQLLDQGTEQIRFGSAEVSTDRWTRQRVIDELHLLPEQLPLYMALTGDASDSVPGMPGIGPKKALKMLQEADWDLVKAMQRHPEHYAIVRTSEALVDLSYEPVATPEVPLLDLVGPDHSKWPELVSFCDFYRLQRIQNRLISRSLWT